MLEASTDGVVSGVGLFHMSRVGGDPPLRAILMCGDLRTAKEVQRLPHAQRQRAIEFSQAAARRFLPAGFQHKGAAVVPRAGDKPADPMVLSGLFNESSRPNWRIAPPFFLEAERKADGENCTYYGPGYDRTWTIELDKDNHAYDAAHTGDLLTSGLTKIIKKLYKVMAKRTPPMVDAPVDRTKFNEFAQQILGVHEASPAMGEGSDWFQLVATCFELARTPRYEDPDQVDWHVDLEPAGIAKFIQVAHVQATTTCGDENTRPVVADLLEALSRPLTDIDGTGQELDGELYYARRIQDICRDIHMSREGPATLSEYMDAAEDTRRDALADCWWYLRLLCALRALARPPDYSTWEWPSNDKGAAQGRKAWIELNTSIWPPMFRSQNGDSLLGEMRASYESGSTDDLRASVAKVCQSLAATVVRQGPVVTAKDLLLDDIKWDLDDLVTCISLEDLTARNIERKVKIPSEYIDPSEKLSYTAQVAYTTSEQDNLSYLVFREKMYDVGAVGLTHTCVGRLKVANLLPWTQTAYDSVLRRVKAQCTTFERYSPESHSEGFRNSPNPPTKGHVVHNSEFSVLLGIFAHSPGATVPLKLAHWGGYRYKEALHGRNPAAHAVHLSSIQEQQDDVTFASKSVLMDMVFTGRVSLDDKGECVIKMDDEEKASRLHYAASAKRLLDTSRSRPRG